MSLLHDIHPCLARPTGVPRAGGSRRPPTCDFEEGEIWAALGGGWECLYGCYCRHGVSIEWHDFSGARPRDWARSFHPGSVELCLNLAGHARLAHEGEGALLGPMTAAVYYVADETLSAWRLPAEHHQFLTVEYSAAFLERNLSGAEAELQPVVGRALRRRAGGRCVGEPTRLGAVARKIITSLRQPPVSGGAAGLWYQGKALELMAEFFFAPGRTNGNGQGNVNRGVRQQQQARQRVGRVIEILGRRLADPPTLEALGREAGCSPFYLSRTFSREMGVTIPQYLRQIRMERAAELLKSGKFNVTEAALEVGYSSLSHFSQAFCETMGCCPGLYPLGLLRPVQKDAAGNRA